MEGTEIMKLSERLSERLKKDCSYLKYLPTRNYEISQDYLKELIAEIQALEIDAVLAKEIQEKAANWDMLEQLPDEALIQHWESQTGTQWIVYENDRDSHESMNGIFGKTPAEALRKYWEQHEQK